MGQNRFDTKIENLVHRTDPSFADGVLLPFYKGPLVLLALGVANTTPRAVLAIKEEDALLIEIDAFGRKVNHVAWRGKRSAIKWRRQFMYVKLLVEGVEKDLYMPRGKYRRQFQNLVGEFLPG